MPSDRRISLFARSVGVPIATLVLALLAGIGMPDPALGQTGYDRPGQDYASFAVRSADPAVCAQRCDRDRRCRAWSFSYPRTVTSRAMCWLKSGVPARVESSCCVSGVSGGGVVLPRRGTAIEFDLDRSGGDYRNFETEPQGEGQACAAACLADNRCRAWTYVRPGYVGGGAARCYLKGRVTRPRRNPCCISGVVR